MPDSEYDLGVSARDVAWFIWASMVAMPVLFLGVVLALKHPAHDVEPLPLQVLATLGVATSALGILLSRVLPNRIQRNEVGGRAHLTALTRCVVSWSLCEGVAIFPIVAFLVTHEARLLAIFVADMLVLLLSFPSRSRWEAFMPRGDASSLPGVVD